VGSAAAALEVMNAVRSSPEMVDLPVAAPTTTCRDGLLEHPDEARSASFYSGKRRCAASWPVSHSVASMKPYSPF
jgi:hypothetical protein